MTTLDEQARAIIENVNDDFCAMAYEAQKRIARFTSEMRIAIILRMIYNDSDLTTEAWRKKQRRWLEDCVNDHIKRWGDY